MLLMVPATRRSASYRERNAKGVMCSAVTLLPTNSSNRNFFKWPEKSCPQIYLIIEWKIVPRLLDNRAESALRFSSKQWRQILTSIFPPPDRLPKSYTLRNRTKARMVAMGYSQVEGVDYFETFAPTASATSRRLVAAMACKLDWDLRHLDVDQAFIQSELDTDIYLRLPPSCGSISGKVVLLNKALYGLKQSGRACHAVVVDPGGVWFRAMLGRSLCVSADSC